MNGGKGTAGCVRLLGFNQWSPEREVFTPRLTLHPHAHSSVSSIQAFKSSGPPQPGQGSQDISTSNVALFTLTLLRTPLFKNIAVYIFIDYKNNGHQWLKYHLCFSKVLGSSLAILCKAPSHVLRSRLCPYA